jgi:hypothetical protein
MRLHLWTKAAPLGPLLLLLPLLLLRRQLPLLLLLLLGAHILCMAVLLLPCLLLCWFVALLPAPCYCECQQSDAQLLYAACLLAHGRRLGIRRNIHPCAHNKGVDRAR